MTLGIIGISLTLLGLAYLAGATLAVTLRGGRGPGDPPASHLRTDPDGFPVLSAPRGVLHARGPRPAHRRLRPASSRAAAALRRARPPARRSPRAAS